MAPRDENREPGFPRWVSAEDYARALTIEPEQALESAAAKGLLTKTVGGRRLIFVDEAAVSGREAEAGSSSSGPAGGAADAGPTLGAPAEAPAPETLARSFSGVEELALRTERAISLVERSLNTFVMMHQEVVTEKDRFVDLTRSGLVERDRLLEEKKQQLEELSRALRDKEQELADLKMLVEIMEGRGPRTATTPLSAEERDLPSVGDLMEEQLKYIMEDQRVRDLLKE